MTDLSPGLLRTLAVLRWFAVGGQAITLIVVIHVLHVPLTPAPLWFAVAALALFNLWASARARRVPLPSSLEILGHLSVDVAILTWLIVRTGGVMNPFGSLFLLPIALVAVAQPPLWVGLTAALCGLGYGISTLLAKPLPHIHGAFGDLFNLHLWGMAANFVISATVVLCFVTRLAQTLRRREQEIARLREQFARQEGIVALATHAASMAHELNTPLGTLTLLLENQLDTLSASDPKRTEAELMSALVTACRDRVRELAAQASGEASAPEPLNLTLDRVIERWQLLRPEIRLSRTGDLNLGRLWHFDPAIGHLLQVLLNNAADASAENALKCVDLELAAEADELRGVVRDYGPGLAPDAPRVSGSLFNSTKANGLGVGLALSHATVERLGGELSMRVANGGGVAVSFRLPLVSSAR